MHKAGAFLLFARIVFPLYVLGLSTAVEGSFITPQFSPRKASLSSQGHIGPRQSSDEIPLSPPWVYPKVIRTPPACVTSKPSSCSWSLSLIAQCSASKCVETFFGSCMQRDTLVDKSCFCPQLSSENCSPCSTNLEKAQYYHWLNLTCGDVAGWQGLPSSWKSVYSSLDIINVGHVYTPYYDGCGNDLRYGVEPQFVIPECVAKTCPMYSNGWNDALLTPLAAGWANISIPPPTITMQTTSDCTPFLDRQAVCGSLYQLANTSCHSMCPSRLGTAQYLLWLNNTCSSASEFSGLPFNWKEDVASSVANSSLQNNTNRYNTSNLIFPDCVGGSCADVLSQKLNSSSENFCVLDPSGTFCSTSKVLLSLPQFCTNITYPSTCADSCILSFERHELLNFMNTTCSNITGWTGLPTNWSDLLSVQVSELKPWPWLVRNNDPNTNGTVQCPTPASNLGVFAGTNIAMLLLTPILGRRTVVQKLTFGSLGKAHGQSWFYMGPLMAGLQIAANAINALVIKATPGYSDVNIGRLLLLWCTRPRLAWLVILLVPFQSKKVMYLSCAATTLTAEAILQLLSAYTFGTVANYGRIQHFYDLDHRLDNIPYGFEAKLMYAGSLLWLIVIFFALVVIIISVSGVNKGIERLARYVGADERWIKKSLKEAKTWLSLVQSHRVSLLSQGETDQLMQVIQFFAAESYGLVIRSLNCMTESITIDEKDYQEAKTKLKRLKKRSEKRANSIETPEGLNNMIQIVDSLKLQLRSIAEDNVKVSNDALGEIQDRVRQIHKAIIKVSETTRKRIGESDSLYEERTLEKWWVIERDLLQLKETWKKAKERWKMRRDRFSDRRNNQDRLGGLVQFTLIGMVGCWIAQWIFWVGFVGLFSANQGYCPPKLAAMAVNWISFSVLGIPLGASV